MASFPTTPERTARDDPPVPPSAAPLDAGLTPRSLLVAVLFTVLAGLWIRQAEIIVLSALVSSSVPVIPGLAALVLLLPLNAVLRRPFTRGELIVVFLFVTVSSTMMGVGVERRLIGLLTSPLYPFPGKALDLLPAWLMPRDAELVRQMYERSPDGAVPWRLWWGPGLVWAGFFLALWTTLYCLMALFYRRWAEEERLAFPLAALPLQMVGGAPGEGGFFRNPVMWAGFALAALYNAVNILHAYVPSVPALTDKWDLSPAFPRAPWSALTPLELRFTPQMIGLGYLVPTEISLTVWLSFLALKLAAVYGVAMGRPPVGDGTHQPFLREQGIGAYLALAVLLVWVAQRRSRASRRASRDRWYGAGLVTGFLAVWGFVTAAGMAGWVALAYLGMVVVVALVFGRLRAETGTPSLWLWPWMMQQEALLYSFGSQPFLASGRTTLAAWALLSFLASGTFSTLTAYQLEGMELSRRVGMPLTRLALALVLAVVVGFGIGWVLHLTLYYERGALQLPNGEWALRRATLEYQKALGYEQTLRLPETARLAASGIGAVIAAALALLRFRFAAFPLHPLGYAMTCCSGSGLWSSFLLVWLLKSLALRWGGMRFYRRSIPFFLGLALGHFAVAGIFWGIAAAWSGDAAGGYQVFFG
jgi:hypothetical protein